MTRLIGIIDAAHRAGALTVREGPDLSDTLAMDLEGVRKELGTDLPPDAAVRATLVWVSLFGSVNFEVFGQYGSDTFTDASEIFERHLALLADVAGLT
ncbi:hypothetical protein GCM10020255_039150 [Rhodococcus baikonurensis]